ncbi:cysteine-rich repeat secretory protein 38-like [Bidens hawaiensis]|uniref:cysteine-rich repeat secretory protein 38-like n=1 Tax=Bidens hawaiensis TaxID=980011 RepID=UPI0040491573
MTALKRLPGSVSPYVDNKPDAVSVGALCAGYLKPNDCASCVNSTIPLLQQKCPNQKGAVAWRVKCMVRYGPPVTNNYDIWFVANEISVTKVKDVVGLEKALNSLGGMLSKSLDHRMLYGYGLQAYGSGNQTLHMVMQCTQDTLPNDCNSCLQHISREMKPCCSGATAAAMLTPNCYLRYAHADFRIL